MSIKCIYSRQPWCTSRWEKFKLQTQKYKYSVSPHKGESFRHFYKVLDNLIWKESKNTSKYCFNEDPSYLKLFKNRITYVRSITGRYWHISLHTGASYWIWCCEAGRWSVAVLSEERGRCLAPSPSCWIFYHVWKAIQWNHQREGEDVAGVLSSLTSPHLRGHRGTDTLQHLSAGPRPFSKAWAAPPTSPTRAIVCLGPPIQSRVGDLSLIKARCQGPQCPPTLPFQVGRNRTETDMSALFDLEVMQMVRKGCSEEGRKKRGCSIQV